MCGVWRLEVSLELERAEALPRRSGGFTGTHQAFDLHHRDYYGVFKGKRILRYGYH